MAEVIRHIENFRYFFLVDRHGERVCIWLFAFPNLQNFLYFPNNQLVKFHRIHVNLIT